MGWLRIVGSLKLQVSFAESSLFYRALLQKRRVILRSLLFVATLYFFGSFYSTEPYNQWLLCGKRPATSGILCIFATPQWMRVHAYKHARTHAHTQHTHTCTGCVLTRDHKRGRHTHTHTRARTHTHTHLYRLRTTP